MGYWSRVFNQNSENMADMSHISHYDFIPGTGINTAINFQHILKTGDVDTFQAINPVRPFSEGNQTVNWDNDDAYTNAVDSITSAVKKKIQKDPDLQKLLEKDEWNKENRVEWEKEVSSYVSKEMGRVPGLSLYRTHGGLASTIGAVQVENSLETLNDISNDFSEHLDLNHMQKLSYEFDCEAMSVTEGSILQRIDNAILPDHNTPNNYKVSSNYFYTIGTKGSYGHAYITSSATGNIIESTASSSTALEDPYVENADPNFTFEDQMNGAIFKAKSGMTYGTYQNSSSEHTEAKIELAGVSSIETFRNRIQEAVRIDPEVQLGYGPTGEKLKSICLELNEMDTFDDDNGRGELEDEFEHLVQDSADKMSLSRIVTALDDFERQNDHLIEGMIAQQEEELSADYSTENPEPSEIRTLAM